MCGGETFGEDKAWCGGARLPCCNPRVGTRRAHASRRMRDAPSSGGTLDFSEQKGDLLLKVNRQALKMSIDYSDIGGSKHALFPTTHRRPSATCRLAPTSSSTLIGKRKRLRGKYGEILLLPI